MVTVTEGGSLRAKKLKKIAKKVKKDLIDTEIIDEKVMDTKVWNRHRTKKTIKTFKNAFGVFRDSERSRTVGCGGGCSVKYTQYDTWNKSRWSCSRSSYLLEYRGKPYERLELPLQYLLACRGYTFLALDIHWESRNWVQDMLTLTVEILNF